MKILSIGMFVLFIFNFNKISPLDKVVDRQPRAIKSLNEWAQQEPSIELFCLVKDTEHELRLSTINEKKLNALREKWFGLQESLHSEGAPEKKNRESFLEYVETIKHNFFTIGLKSSVPAEAIFLKDNIQSITKAEISETFLKLESMKRILKSPLTSSIIEKQREAFQELSEFTASMDCLLERYKNPNYSVLLKKSLYLNSFSDMSVILNSFDGSLKDGQDVIIEHVNSIFDEAFKILRQGYFIFRSDIGLMQYKSFRQGEESFEKTIREFQDSKISVDFASKCLNAINAKRSKEQSEVDEFLAQNSEFIDKFLIRNQSWFQKIKDSTCYYSSLAISKASLIMFKVNPS